MQIARRKPLTAEVAVISVGLDTYWGQFPGLLEEMNKKTQVLLKKLEKNQVHVSDFGMIDNSIKAYEMLPAIKASNPDVLMVDMVTYATSATFAAIRRALGTRRRAVRTCRRAEYLVKTGDSRSLLLIVDHNISFPSVRTSSIPSPQAW